jgi:hypothetical protein
MKKRVAIKVLFDFSRPSARRVSSVRAASAQLSRWANASPMVAPLHGEVFGVVSFMCKNWLRLLRGSKLDDRCVVEYQRGSARTAAQEAAGSLYACRRSLIVAYRRTGDFDRFGAELLKFDHVVGDLGLVAGHYGIVWTAGK